MPVNWVSNSESLAYTGHSAIINSEYIVDDYYRNGNEIQWKISVDDISRYSIKNNDKYSFITFFLKDGSQQVLTLKSKEVTDFISAYQEAIETKRDFDKILDEEYKDEEK